MGSVRRLSREWAYTPSECLESSVHGDLVDDTGNQKYDQSDEIFGLDSIFGGGWLIIRSHK